MMQPQPPGSGQLTIGVDARAASEVRAGRGRVVRELLRALCARQDGHRYRCYAREAWDQPLDSRFSWSLNTAPDPLWHVRAAIAANRECDVFLSSNSYLTVLMLRVPSVVTVHDLLALDPKTRPRRASALIERLTLAPAARRADKLWCVSAATKDALTERIPSSRGKVTVVPLGVSEDFLRASRLGRETVESLPGPGFVLAVGTLEPRKNLPRLVAAYTSLPDRLQDQHPLVVVGARGWRVGETLGALQSLGQRCRIMGDVSDQELAELYRRCAVFCYPSLGEGFGLPVLEAMAAGAAVVTSGVTSLPEVGGSAVEYIDPASVDSIADGIRRLLDSPSRRAELGELAQERAKLFTWDACAESVLALLDAAQASSRS